MKKLLLSLLFLPTLSAAVSAQVDASLPVIDIQYNGSTATVIIPSGITDVMLTSSPGSPNVSLYSMTLDQEYCYRVSGSTTNGSLLINGNYKMTLELAGCSITNPMGGAIDVECGKRIAVVLDEGTDNRLEDGAFGSQKAALYFSGHPEFEGHGSLSVQGNLKHAISAKEYLELKENLGTIQVLGAMSDGIHCGRGKKDNVNNYFEMKGGHVIIAGTGSDCIDADDYGTVKIKGGRLDLTVSATKGSAVKADELLRVEGGDTHITITASDAEGFRCNGTALFSDGDITIDNNGAGSKGIKLKSETTGTTLDGGIAEFSGTDVSITLSGGDMEDGSRCMGISVDKTMTLSAGDINIMKTNDASKSYNVKGGLSVSGTGQINEMGTHYPDMSTSAQNDMQIYAIAELNGTTVTDYANYQIAAYNTANGNYMGRAVVVTMADNRQYLDLRTYAISSATIGFRLYDASTGKELESTNTVAFRSNNTQGRPSAPFVMSFTSVVCDINRDGQLSVADLAALIAILNGRDSAQPYRFDHTAADVNKDGAVSKADVTELLQILKNQ